MIRLHALLIFMAATAVAAAQPATPAPAPAAKSDSTVLVPPQGGTADIPVKFSANVLLTFPSPLAPRVVKSSTDWEVRDFEDSVVARALTPNAQPTTIALASRDGTIRVNITLRLVPETADSLSLVRFQSATTEEAFLAAVEVEVERRTATMRAAMEAKSKAMDAEARTRSITMTLRSFMSRVDVQRLKATERSDDNVVVRGQRVVMFGADAAILFEIENRSDAAYRLASVKVLTPDGANHASQASVGSNAATSPEPTLLGSIPSGTTATVSVFVPAAGGVAGKPLRLVVAEPGGRREIVVARGMTLR